MPNGSGGNEAVWKAIDGLRDDYRELAVKGCAFRASHDEGIKDERKERKEAMDQLSRELKAVRTQILVGVILVMMLTLVIDKVLR